MVRKVLSGATVGVFLTSLCLLAPRAEAMQVGIGPLSGLDLTYHCFIANASEKFDMAVHVSAMAPATADQGTYFQVEQVTFSFQAPDGISYEASGTLARAPFAGGDDVISSGPWTVVSTGEYQTDPSSGTFAVWGPVGQRMNFFAGPLHVEANPSDGPADCEPATGAPPVVSVLIEPPAGGGPITDEVGVKVVAPNGTVLYARQSFLASGNFVARRNAGGHVELLSGTGTYPTSGAPASITIISGSPSPPSTLGPATVLSLSDPAAGVQLSGFSTVASKSSGTRESVAGFAQGYLKGYALPVGIYWFVRDLT